MTLLSLTQSPPSLSHMGSLRLASGHTCFLKISSEVLECSSHVRGSRLPACKTPSRSYSRCPLQCSCNQKSRLSFVNHDPSRNFPRIFQILNFRGSKTARETVTESMTETVTENVPDNGDRERLPRRSLLGGIGSAIFLAPYVFSGKKYFSASAAAAEKDDILDRLEELVESATAAWERGQDPSNPNRLSSLYESRIFFDKIIEIDPQRDEWLEARGQVEVDAKLFTAALVDFTEAIRRNPQNYRAYASRALAYEGLSLWQNAIEDYTKALTLGQKLTGTGPEPYVMNSRGNAYASIGAYELALKDYEGSRKGFQLAKALDGAIYAASNAALIRIQLGEEEEGVRGLTAVARRAPASIDMRAALTAVYWAQGKEEEAEEEWNFACQNINTGTVFDGCNRYKDQDWLKRIRRWPPVMVQRMDDFFNLRIRK